MNKDLILLHFNYVNPPKTSSSKADFLYLGTILSNIIYYGYIPSVELHKQLSSCSQKDLISFWKSLEPSLKEITGDSKKMSDHVVYKNFPKEVLDMSEAEYRTNQILIYHGLDYSVVSQEEKARPSITELTNCKVLQASNSNTLLQIFYQLLSSPTKWTRNQKAMVKFLLPTSPFDVSKIPFKENLTYILSYSIENNLSFTLKSATDVLRLAKTMSNTEETLNTKVKFTSLKRKERKFLLGLLENSSNLSEDIARDKETWKRFLYSLHANDYKKTFPKVSKVVDLLYHNKVKSFNSKIEQGILNKDASVLKLLSSRMGDYSRRLHHLINTFGDEAVSTFIQNLDKLSIYQLLKIQRYIKTINYRTNLTVAPKGNWTKLQVLENKKHLNPRHEDALLEAIKNNLSKRLKSKIESVYLDKKTEYIKIPDNNSDLTPYGRGTIFNIPKNIKFIRSASYWQTKDRHNIWYDNGWNFFDSEWKSIGTVCWNSTASMPKAAVFSGDPTSSKTKDGKACQMIDIYLEELSKRGVRYCVWNILCYSHKSFDEADVWAALQWGEDPIKGKLFEPSRCQLSFPVKGKNLTKYIAYIDVEKRQLVYMDANLRGTVSSAAQNTMFLEDAMPAFTEYLDTLPSVYDLFENAKQSSNGTPILYSDEEYLIKDPKAYVFQNINEKNKIDQINLNAFLND